MSWLGVEKISKAYSDYSIRKFIIYYLSEVLFWFRPALVDARVKIYWEKIVISDAITLTGNLEIAFQPPVNIQYRSGEDVFDLRHFVFDTSKGAPLHSWISDVLKKEHHLRRNHIYSRQWIPFGRICKNDPLRGWTLFMGIPTGSVF